MLREGPRFVRVPASRTTAVLTVAEHIVLTLIAGSVATGVAALAMGFALDERLIVLPSSWGQLDWFARKLIPFPMFGAMALAPVYGLLLILRGVSTDADVRRFCATPGDAMPLAAQRGEWEKVRQRLEHAGWSTLLFGGIMLLIGLILLTKDTPGTRHYSLWMMGISAAIALVGLLAVRFLPKTKGTELYVPGGDFSVLTAAEKQTARVIKAQLAARSEDPPETLPGRWPRIDALSNRLMMAGLWAVGVAFVSLLGAVLLRQPCRFCEPRFYASPIEAALAVVFGIVTVATVAAVVLLTVGPMLALVSSLGTARLVREQSVLPGIGELRPSDEALHQLLHQPSALRGLGTVIGMWGCAFLWFWLSAVVEAAYGHVPFSEHSWWWALAVAVVLLIASGAVLTRARRQSEVTGAAVRAAWPIVDPPRTILTAWVAGRRRRPRRRSSSGT
ncbi:hypothetical protein BW730_12815 [Tessaracoccus aquimaris]|uniref:Uncharacterized protein n=2 Tax=Tessaracoccus aquimaris TaxID=1332264 RepID=A0A1Q2CQ85_9ACTN|nr:hypothetical protein BW730_12815 [Tessaracoccus aquimaris]